jgi:carbonic anhydrase
MRSGLDLERPSMSVPNDNQTSWPQTEVHDDPHVWADQSSDFVLIAEGKPPSRIE